MADEEKPPAEASPDQNQTPRKLRWFLRSVLVIGILILCSPFLVRTWVLWDLPAVPHPFDVEEFLAAEIPQEQNAASFYANAESLRIEPTEDEEKLLETLVEDAADDWGEALTGLEDYLTQNEDSLKVWRKGTLDPYFSPRPLADRYLASDLEVEQLRRYAKNAYLKSCMLDSSGQHEAAREWILAIVRNSRQLGHHGCVQDRLVGVGQFRYACQRLEYWSSQRAVSSQLLKDTLSELQQQWARTPLSSMVLKGEYVTGSNTLDAVDTKDAPITFQQLAGDDSANATLVQKLCWIIGEPDSTRRLYAFYVHNRLSAVDLPLQARPQRTGAARLYDQGSALSYHDLTLSAEEFEENVNFSWGIFSRLRSSLFSEMIHFPEACDLEDVRYKCVLVILAGQAYRRDYGSFPKSLDQLVPDYLEAIPIDPYDGKPMKYREDRDHPVVYSSFLNGIDDGGEEYNHRTASGHELLDFGMRLLSERVRVQFGR